MSLQLYDTFTRTLRNFEPLEAGVIRMYHCGPTVYQRPHIGNYRAFLFADLLRRVFDARGFKVIQVMNLTDVGHIVGDAEEGEDKLEVQAKRDQVDPWELVAQVSAEFFKDLNALGVRPAHEYPRATDHIPEMVELIQNLVERGHAYQVGENVYFDVSSFASYGKLSGNQVEDLEAGARLEVNPEKKHPADFALWKSDERHLMKWDTVFGKHGFPGWHIECSAMAMKYLGTSFDIHTGGEDNVFPHHECEIAQSECATGKPFVQTWMHTKFLKVDGGKMSKSLGNVYNLDDIREKGFDPLDFRFLILKAHYRGSLNFTWEGLAGAAEARRSLSDFRGRLNALSRQETGNAEESSYSGVSAARKGFEKALDDDLNTSAALAAVFGLRQDLIKGKLPNCAALDACTFLDEVDAILGLFDEECSQDALSDDAVESLLKERKEAREAQNWSLSDEIRDQLLAEGITIEDDSSGTSWHRSG